MRPALPCSLLAACFLFSLPALAQDTTPYHIPKDRIAAMQHDGLAYTQEISVPEKGGPYFLRIGVQDQFTNKVGALEISVTKIANLPPLTPAK